MNLFLADIQCQLSTIWTFDSITNKLSLYRGEEYVKKFFISLREHEADVIKLRKEKKLVSVHKKIAKLTSRFNRMLHLEKKNCLFIGKYLCASHSICNLRFNVLNEIAVVFVNE